MSSRLWSSSGYRGVRARHSRVFYAEIRSGDTRLGLGTFETVHEAVRVYDGSTWRLGQPQAQMNFHDIFTREQAHDVAPPHVWSPRRTAASSRIMSTAS
ncbi:putative AP2 protein [Hordeum vulgare]|nr:putative AP2 protein [Hordeum vulgare]